MATYKTESSDYFLANIGGKERRLLSTEACDRFDTNLLGLGDLMQDSTSTDSIAAVFDLEGFTNFCKQIEPHLLLVHVSTWLQEFKNFLGRGLHSIDVDSILKVPMLNSLEK